MRVRVMAYLVLVLAPVIFFVCAISHISRIHNNVASYAISQAAALDTLDALDNQLVAKVR